MIDYRKTDNAIRHIPLSPRVAAILEMRRTATDTGRVFPTVTKSGRVEPITFKKQHALACNAANVKHFPL